MNDTLTRVKHYTKVDGSHFSPGSSDHNKDACLICREPSYIMWLGVPFSLTAVEKIPVVCWSEALYVGVRHSMLVWGTLCWCEALYVGVGHSMLV